MESRLLIMILAKMMTKKSGDTLNITPENNIGDVVLHIKPHQTIWIHEENHDTMIGVKAHECSDHWTVMSCEVPVIVVNAPTDEEDSIHQWEKWA